MLTDWHTRHEATARTEHVRSAVDTSGGAYTGDDRASRRAVLGVVATAAAVGHGGLAGCLGDDEGSAPKEPPDPVALDGGLSVGVLVGILLGWVALGAIVAAVAMKLFE